MKKYWPLFIAPFLPLAAAFGYHYGPNWIIPEVWAMTALAIMGLLIGIYLT